MSDRTEIGFRDMRLVPDAGYQVSRVAEKSVTLYENIFPTHSLIDIHHTIT